MSKQQVLGAGPLAGGWSWGVMGGVGCEGRKGPDWGQVWSDGWPLGLGVFPSAVRHKGEFSLAGNSLINQGQWGADRQPLPTGQA